MTTSCASSIIIKTLQTQFIHRRNVIYELGNNMPLSIFDHSQELMNNKKPGYAAVAADGNHNTECNKCRGCRVGKKTLRISVWLFFIYFCLSLVPKSSANNYPSLDYISTIAGDGTNSTGGTGNSATSTSLNKPACVWGDTLDNLYISEGEGHVVRKISGQDRRISTVVGVSGASGYSEDGSPATSAELNFPAQIIQNPVNKILYIADSNNHRIRAVNLTSSIITTFAGNGISENGNDNGPATSASLNAPIGVWVSASGVVFISSSSEKIRKVDDGIISSIQTNQPSMAHAHQLFGDGSKLYVGGNSMVYSILYDNQQQEAEDVYGSDYEPRGVWGHPGGTTVFFADSSGHVIKEGTAASSSWVAGSGTASSSPGDNNGDGGPLIEATFNQPYMLFVDRRGFVYVADSGNNKIRKLWNIAPSSQPSAQPSSQPSARPTHLYVALQQIETVAGNGNVQATSPNIPATSAAFSGPVGVWASSGGELYVSTSGADNNKVVQVSAASRLTSVFAGVGPAEYVGNNGPASSAGLSSPQQIHGDTLGNVYIADRNNNKIRKVNSLSGIIVLFAGGATAYEDEVAATSVFINKPTGVWCDNVGNVYVSELDAHVVRRVSGEIIRIFAGMRESGFSGGSATAASLSFPRQLFGTVTDSTLYVVDYGNRRVRAITSSYGATSIKTTAGSGISNEYFHPTVGQATSIALKGPTGITGDTDGNLFIADFNSSVVCRVRPHGLMSVLVGDPHETMSSEGTDLNGDGSLSSYATLNSPQMLFANTLGNLFIADSGNNKVRRMYDFSPTVQPTSLPPTPPPSNAPTTRPSSTPTIQPSNQPFGQPTGVPTQPTSQPTRQPIANPTSQPSAGPVSDPSSLPPRQPSTQPTGQPTGQPTARPSGQPRAQPSTQPSAQPSSHPTGPPAAQPTSEPSLQPTASPTTIPSEQPSSSPTAQPSGTPTAEPSNIPTSQPTISPTAEPAADPTSQPSSLPTMVPSEAPSAQPSSVPSDQPAAVPSSAPSADPSVAPSVQPSGAPTCQPLAVPSAPPTTHPTCQPTGEPSSQPSAIPSGPPSVDPTVTPSQQPSSHPTSQPSAEPSGRPSVNPTVTPSQQPSFLPTSQPSVEPSGSPSTQPTAVRSSGPSGSLTQQPSDVPSSSPTTQPSTQPAHPTRVPTSHPTVHPTALSSIPSPLPTEAPTCWPASQPTDQPSSQPSSQPTPGATTAIPTTAPIPSAAPTPAPTKPTADQWLDKLTDIQTSLYAELAATTAVHTSVYSEVGVVGSTLRGGCSSWVSVLSGDIQPSNVEYKAIEVRMTVAQSLSSKPDALSCTTFSEVQQIMAFLASTANMTLNVTCDQHQWIGRYCPSAVGGLNQPALCVDCANPCSVESRCAVTTIDDSVVAQYPFVVSSCVTHMCGSSRNTSAVRVLSVAFDDREQPPAMTLVTVNATRSSVTVNVGLDSAGSVACAVYRDYSAQPSLNTVPTSHAQILLQNHVAPSREGNVSIVVIGGLSALTDYKLYCMAVSASNTMTPMSTVLVESQSVTTTCCKLATVSTSATSVVANKNILNFLTVSLSSPPSSPVQIRLTVHNTTTNEEVQSALVPSVFAVPASTSSQQPVTLTSSLSGLLRAGGYFVAVNITGSAAASDYEVRYDSQFPGGLNFTVLSGTQSMPAPVMTSAVFAPDGSHVKVSFDSATDRGSTATKFICSQLFNFTCAATSSCQWVDSATVHAYVTSESHCAAPGDQLSLQPSVTIKAACSGDCASWPSVTATAALTIRASSASESPSLAVSAPATIGQYSPLVVDISGSTGGGGRPWASSSRVTVSAVASQTANVTAIQHFLDTQYKVSPPTPIPWQLLTSGVTYTFTATMCNFMGKCSQRQSRTTVLGSLLPTVTLPGAATRYARRNAVLSISADAYVADSTGGKTTAGMTYQWSVSANNVQLPRLMSESRDPSKLLLPAYSLSVGTLYSVSLTVTVISSQKAAVSSVQVMVEQGGVVASIAGSTSRTVLAGGVLDLDASASSDEDKQVLSGTTTSSLVFDWSCRQVAPVLRDDCNDIFVDSDAINSTGAQFTATAASSAAGAEADISLTVSDFTGGRSATSAVRLTVLPDMSPVVALSSNAVNSVVNSDREVQLFGSITLPTASGAVEGGNVTWSVDDTSIVSLAEVALAPLFVPIPPGTARFDVYLVMGANSLPTGSSLSFTLTCNSAGGYSSSAAVKMVINAPPQPGTFTAAALAASPLYALAASNWIDADLPLTYQFGYTSKAGAKVALTTRSAATNKATRVPVGLASTGYMVQCFAEIFDYHNANTTATAFIQVMPSAAADAQSQVVTLFASSRATVNEKKQIAAVASGLLNTVDCSLTPDCASLNRAACHKTRNTCGECKLSYIGDAGDSNSQCQSLTTVSVLRRLAASELSVCTSSDQCALFQDCVNGVCIAPLKQCPSDCSGHGQCVAENADSGAVVAECRVGDSTCNAVCVCEAEYEGSSDCSMSSTETAARQASRELIINSISDLMELEDPDAQSVEAWINCLSEATQAPDELSEEALSLVLGLSSTLMDYASQVGLSSGYVQLLLRAIDSASKASANAYARRRRRLDDVTGTANYSSSLAQSGSALQKYANLISTNMLPGQYPVELVYSQFRSNIQVYSAAGGASNLSVSVPQSALEQMNGRQSSSFSLPYLSSNSSEAPLRVSVVSMLSSLYQAVEGSLESNPLTISMSAMPTCEVPPCNIEIVLQYSQSLNRTELHPNEQEFIETVCLKDVIVASNHTCSDGSIISLFCNGTANILSTQCPYTEFSPVCNSLLGSDIVTGVCTAVAVTDTNITCSCPMVTADSMHRMQLNSNSTGYSASYVSMLSTIRTSFLTTVRSADDLDEDTLRKGWRAIVTVGVFAAAVIVALISSNQADERQKKNKTKGKGGGGETVPPGAKSLLESLKPRNKVATNSSTAADGDKRSAEASQGGGINKDLALVESSLPSVLSSQTLTSRILHEVKHNHRWLGVVFFYTDSFPRVLRVMSLATNIIIMLFIQSLTYTLTNPDDGSCDVLVTRVTCEEPASPFATGESKCAWDGTQCTFIQPGSRIKVILFVAIFSAIISTPFALGTEWFIRHILAAGTLKRNKVSAGTATAAAAATGGPSPAATGSGRRGDRRAAVNTKQATVFLAQAELASLSAALYRYRESLSVTQRIEFDLVWGLNERGRFKSPDDASEPTVADQNMLQQLTHLCQAATKKKTDVKQTVLDDLTRIIDSVAEESKTFESTVMSKRSIGRKMLFLFQCDLLPGISGKILHNKGQRDAMTAKRVPLSYKVAAWTLLFLQNAGMLFYILLFALSESEQRQGAWLQSFILWLVVEILAVSTAIAIFTHVVVPLMTMKDVTKIKQRLMENVQAFHQSVANKKSRPASDKYQIEGAEVRDGAVNEEHKVFNAAEFLFVSNAPGQEVPRHQGGADHRTVQHALATTELSACDGRVQGLQQEVHCDHASDHHHLCVYAEQSAGHSPESAGHGHRHGQHRHHRLHCLAAHPAVRHLPAAGLCPLRRAVPVRAPPHSVAEEGRQGATGQTVPCVKHPRAGSDPQRRGTHR